MLTKLRNFSVLKQFIILIFALLIILLASFTITNIIAKKTIEQNAIQSTDKIVLQVKDKITTFYSDMENISHSLNYGPTINSFIRTEDQLERILSKKDVDSVFSNTFMLKENIVGIALYDKKIELISKMGQHYGMYKIDDITSISSLYYSGIVNPSTNSNSKNYVIIAPIYDLSLSGFKMILGYCEFIMNTVNFNQILQNSLITKNSMMFLLDQNDTIIASEGLDINDTFDFSLLSDKKYFTQEVTLENTNWKIISLIPKSELYSQLNIVQKFNVYAYIMIAGILIMFIILFFVGILKPINKLIRFMQSYSMYSKNNRIENIKNNEVGKMANTLNEMLDDIEQLTSKVQQSQKRIYDIDIAKKQMEITSYRNQINPHFLYNTFECIRAMAFYYDAKDIGDLTEALSKLFRYTVKGDNFSTVCQEVSIIREYAKIIGFRFMGRIQIEVNVDDRILEKKIIKMLLQPIVENAVFHGLEMVPEGGLITINLSLTEDNKMKFTIEDNGLGISDEKLNEFMKFMQNYDIISSDLSSTHGVGLTNIYRRLKLFYNEQVDFQIWTKDNAGTKITITVPIFEQGSEGEDKNV